MPDCDATAWVDALRTAARWRLVGLTLECPGPGWSGQLAALAGEVDDESLRGLSQAAAEQASPELYHTTFGPGGPAAPREVSYAETIQPGQLLGDIQAFYDAFAYRPTIDEPVDHIAVELGFVGYLHLKVAYALSHGDAAAAEVAAQAAERFIALHLRNIVAPLGRLVEQSQIDYLQMAVAELRKLADFDAPPPADAAFRPDTTGEDLNILPSCDDSPGDEIDLDG